ncbi:ABC transporter substrate-binding protein [Fodinicurvata sp. EGI_FJ10296]|uniref:ABC transporter substrate-binding protein n=1 Tax=Fodinicurvata sp. EGI_FJ10296 TaxID=3231908 RepID=UPI0034546813
MTRRHLFASSALAAATLLHAVSPATADDGSIRFEDQDGRTITLDGPAERIITIPMPSAAMMVAVDGGTERLAGMHPMSKAAVRGEILGELFPEMLSVPDGVVGEGFMPNIEEVLTQDPDLVFQWAHRGADIIEPLENAGLTVAGLSYGTEEDTRAWIRMMATATGQPERADTLIDWRDGALREVGAAVEDAVANADPSGDSSEAPTVLYFNRFLSDLRVAGSETYNDFYIGLAGGANPAADAGSGWLTVDQEQVLAWDPDVILLNGFESDLSPQDVYDHPVLSNLTAAAERRVYQMPLGGYRWDPPNQESPLTWMWLAEILHPDLDPDWTLRSEIIDAYQMLYGATLTQSQIDGILRVTANSDSAGYERFHAD